MKKSVFSLAILLSCLLMMGGCGSDDLSSSADNEQQVVTENTNDVLDDTVDSENTEDTNNVVSAPDAEVPDQNITEQTSAEYTGNLVVPYTHLIDLTNRMASGYMRIDHLEELCDYINEQVSVGNLTMSLEYTPGIENLDPLQIAWAASQMSVTYSEVADNPKALELTVHLYPGDKVANAYLTGDSTGLNADELQVLDIATKVVEDAKATATSELELEKILHDWTCEQIKYQDGDRDVEDVNNPPRFLTAVGGVLDGLANCQGYTDTFSMLAKMAGFRIGRLCAYTETDTHMLNIIYIDKGWYILDTTYDDREFEDGSATTIYTSFNATLDRRGEMMWEEELQYLPIRETVDENFYYKMPSDLTGIEYPIWYDTLEEAAEGVWTQSSENGHMVQRIFVPDADDDDGSEFGNLLSVYRDQLGLSNGYSFTVFANGPDTCYEVRID